MSRSATLSLERVLAVDIGATNVKFCLVDAEGELLESPRRRPTPYPCTPERLVEVVADRIVRSEVTRAGVGFPGEFADGRVVGSGNLARTGGVGTPVDSELAARWRGFEFQRALVEATGVDVRVVNDATLAALGACHGVGREAVITLGTGFGLALIVDGERVRVRDVGAAEFDEGRTYDQALGERARSEDEVRWRGEIVEAVQGFVTELDAQRVYLAGGNARRVSSEMFARVRVPVSIVGNLAALRGAARLFYPA